MRKMLKELLAAALRRLADKLAPLQPPKQNLGGPEGGGNGPP